MRRDPALRFAAAALLSLGLHALLVMGGWLRPPAMKAESTLLLEARLAPAAPLDPPPAARPAPTRREISPPRSPRRTQQPVSPPRVVASPAPSAYEVPSPSAEEPSGTTAQDAPLAQSATAPPSTPSEPAAAPAVSEAPVLAALPRKGRIRYIAYLGSDRFTVGKTVQTWELKGNDYKLGSVSETTGIVEFFRAQRHIYLSEGKLTARGLRPERFFMSRTRRGRTEAAQALFDWQAGQLTLGKVPERHREALVADAQDIVSFMYQLALAPPAPGRTRLAITNGSRFETYEIDVLEEEKIETPLGVMRTLPIRQIPRPGAESIAFWLAVDHLHLPVKIRFFDREGRPVGEQIVEEIELSDG